MLATAQAIHDDLEAALTVLFEVCHAFYWWIVWHLEDKLTSFHVVGDEHADNLRVVDEVQHGSTILLAHRLA